MNNRPTRTQMLLDVAHMISRRGTCDRLNVGAVIAVDGRILSTGYNGVPAGFDHCNHQRDADLLSITTAIPYDLRQRLASDQVSGEPCIRSVHAEANAIVFAAKNGVSIERAEMYCTHAPCYMCAKLIINAGIEFVIFDEPFRDPTGVELLEQHGLIQNRMMVKQYGS